MASATVGASVTNTNPVKTWMPRPRVVAQKSVDGLSYTVTTPTGASATVPAATFEALMQIVPDTVSAAPIMDRPHGASSAGVA